MHTMPRMFARLTKVDAARNEVWGRLTQEIPDNSKEVMDYVTSKPQFEAWSQEFEKITDGKSLGNVRAMHGSVAAGKLIHIDFNDDEMAVDIGTHIVDPVEMQKCLEGVYTGFSVGGKYLKKWMDGGLTRYTAKPSEASLVDKPCVPTAKFFEVIKMDGTKTQGQFKTPEAAVDELARMLNKGEISPVALVQLAKLHKDDGDGEDDEEGDDLERPSEVPQDEWDDMTRQEKEDAIEEYGKKDDGAPPPSKDTPAEHNAKVEKIARALAVKAFDKLPIERRTGMDQATFDKLSKSDQTKAMGAPDQHWQEYVPEATRGLAELEKREFTEGQRKAAAKEGAALPDGSFPIENVSDLENAVQAYGRAKNKDAAKAHIISRAKALGATDKLPDDWAKSEEIVDLSKAFAELLPSLVKIAEQATLRKDTTHAEFTKRLKDPKLPFAELLKIASEHGVTADDMVLYKGTHTEQLRDATLAKYGARHSAVDMGHLQTAHDCLAKLGATCSGAESGRPGADTTQGPAHMNADKGNDGAITDVEKGEGLGNHLLVATLRKNVETLTEQNTSLEKRLKKLEDQPLPMKGKSRAVSKGEDNQEEEGKLKKVESTPGQHNPAAAMELIKQQVVETGGLRKF